VIAAPVAARITGAAVRIERRALCFTSENPWRLSRANILPVRIAKPFRLRLSLVFQSPRFSLACGGPSTPQVINKGKAVYQGGPPCSVGLRVLKVQTLKNSKSAFFYSGAGIAAPVAARITGAAVRIERRAPCFTSENPWRLGRANVFARHNRQAFSASPLARLSIPLRFSLACGGPSTPQVIKGKGCLSRLGLLALWGSGY